MNGTTPTTQDTPDKGRLQINLVSDISAYPIQGVSDFHLLHGCSRSSVRTTYYRQFRADRYD